MSRTSRIQRIFVVAALLISACSFGVTSMPGDARADIPGVPQPVIVVATAPSDGNFIQNTFTAIATAAEKLKGFSLDPIAWAVEKAVLQAVVNSVVKWINSGFNGSPAFVTNLNTTLLKVGDTVANQFIQQLASNAAIKSPFQSVVASAVNTTYLKETANNSFFAQNPYTLNQVTTNDAAFLNGDFTQGGFNSWFSAIQPQNNAYGAYQLAYSGLDAQVSNAKVIQNNELQWGNGFLSWRGTCQTSTTGKSTTAPATTATTNTTTGNSLGGSLASSASVSLSGNSGCQSQNIITPGGAISSSLYKALGSGIDTLVTASQFNELVNALLGQLINHVLGGGGLAGLSQPSTSTGGVAYFDQTVATPQQSATGAAVGATPQQSATGAAGTAFSNTVTNQIVTLQSFQTGWTTIQTAANAAAQALQNSTCGAAGQTILATEVQPIVNQASNELSVANASISALNTVSNEAPTVNSDGSLATTAQVNQATNDYTTLLCGTTCGASVTLPSTSDVLYAQTQSVDTSGTTATPTLYTQMNQITQEAQSCNFTPTIPSVTVTGTGP